jgi:NADPH2:quinone reductase
MRAAMCRELGGPEQVAVEDVPSAPVGPGEARVRIGAAAVNFPDVLLMAGEYQIKVPPPFVPGSEFAGVVVEVGAEVTAVAVGDRVTGTGITGAFAEEAVVPAAGLQPVPDGLDLAHAAAFGVGHRTAFHVLRSVARLQAGDELVVLGAGGGVGLAAVQIGHVLGATVTAVASSPRKLEVAEAHGAANLIDHHSLRPGGRAGDLRAALRDVLPDGSDVVVDPVGGDLAEPALRSLHYGGRFVTVGYAAGAIPRIPLNLVLLKGIEIRGFQFIDFVMHAPDEYRRNEDELAALVREGRVRPHVGDRFPLSDVAAALRLVADGGAVGKVVVDVDTSLT